MKQLEDFCGLVQIPEPVSAKTAQRGTFRQMLARQTDRDSRQQDLATVRSVAVDGAAVLVAVAQVRLARWFWADNSCHLDSKLAQSLIHSA
jgi:hypothetical protein